MARVLRSFSACVVALWLAYGPFAPPGFELACDGLRRDLAWERIPVFGESLFGVLIEFQYGRFNHRRLDTGLIPSHVEWGCDPERVKSETTRNVNGSGDFMSVVVEGEVLPAKHRCSFA